MRLSISQKKQAGLEFRARQHRSCLTPSEERLWSALKARQLGVQFRLEVMLGARFIVDFFASAAGLFVEVDGGYHSRRRAANASRDRKLRRLGYRVILFWDRGGLVLYYKRLERGRFRSPRITHDGRAIEMDATELAMLLDGIDVRRVRRAEHWKPPAAESA